MGNTCSEVLGVSLRQDSGLVTSESTVRRTKREALLEANMDVDVKRCYRLRVHNHLHGKPCTDKCIDVNHFGQDVSTYGPTPMTLETVKSMTQCSVYADDVSGEKQFSI